MHYLHEKGYNRQGVAPMDATKDLESGVTLSICSFIVQSTCKKRPKPFAVRDAFCMWSRFKRRLCSRSPNKNGTLIFASFGRADSVADYPFVSGASAAAVIPIAPEAVAA